MSTPGDDRGRSAGLNRLAALVNVAGLVLLIAAASLAEIAAARTSLTAVFAVTAALLAAVGVAAVLYGGPDA